MIENKISEKSVSKWKLGEVLTFLENIGLTDFMPVFRKNHINGKDLLTLTDQNLKEDLCITDLHLRKKLLRKINKIAQNECIFSWLE